MQIYRCAKDQPFKFVQQWRPVQDGNVPAIVILEHVLHFGRRAGPSLNETLFQWNKVPESVVEDARSGCIIVDWSSITLQHVSGIVFGRVAIFTCVGAVFITRLFSEAPSNSVKYID